MSALTDWLLRARPIDISRGLEDATPTNGVAKKRTMQAHAARIQKVLAYQGYQAYVMPADALTARIAGHLASSGPAIALPRGCQAVVTLPSIVPQPQLLLTGAHIVSVRYTDTNDTEVVIQTYL